MTFAHPRVRFSRPTDTTQYTANDAVGPSTTAADTDLVFSLGALRGKKSGRILGGRLSKSTNTATVATFALHLFDREKTPTQGDNGAAVNYGDNVGYLGSLAFDLTTGTTAVFGGAIAIAATALTQPITFQRCENIYGYLVATGAYAPGNAEVFDVSLDIEA